MQRAQAERQQQQARGFWASDLPMHIRELNEYATLETIEYITHNFLQTFHKETATYTHQARTSDLPSQMLRFIKDSLKAKGEWLEYSSDSDTCQ
jgi:hypothetical protein